jgi:hypothetical protein
MRIIVCILAISAIILVGTVAAAPGLPDSFYGSVYLNGNQAPAGTVIVAKINGEPRGEITTTVTGQYGDAGNFDPKLNVAATEVEAASGNATITFFVGGVQAFQTVPFKSGGGEKLDLIANAKAFGSETTVAATYSSSGSSAVVSNGVGEYSREGSTSSVQGVAGTTTPATASRSSVYYNIDGPQTTPAITLIPTTVSPSSPSVTTVPTTKKAGMGSYSMMFLVTSIIAMFGIISRSTNFRNRK